MNLLPLRSESLSDSLAFVGLILLLGRRLTRKRIFAHTSTNDFVTLGLLLFVVTAGLYNALFGGYGTAGFIHRCSLDPRDLDPHSRSESHGRRALDLQGPYPRCADSSGVFTFQPPGAYMERTFPLSHPQLYSVSPKGG